MPTRRQNLRPARPVREGVEATSTAPQSHCASTRVLRQLRGPPRKACCKSCRAVEAGHLAVSHHISHVSAEFSCCQSVRDDVLLELDPVQLYFTSDGKQSNQSRRAGLVLDRKQNPNLTLHHMLVVWVQSALSDVLKRCRDVGCKPLCSQQRLLDHQPSTQDTCGDGCALRAAA